MNLPQLPSSRAPGPSSEDPAILMRLYAADGFLDLGAPNAALQQLEGVKPITATLHAQAVSLRVQAFSMIFGPDVGGLEAVPAANEEDATLKVIETAMIEALNLGNALEVLRLKQRLDARGAPECAGVWHNTAAAHVMLRQYDQAIVAVYQALRLPNDDLEWCLLDAHLAPLWHHLADGPVSAFGERLRGWRGLPALADLVESARGLRPVCWHTAHLLLPDKITGWMSRDRNMTFELNPGAPVEVRRRLGVWLDNRRDRMTRVLRRAIRAGGQTHGLGSDLGVPEPPEASPHHVSGDDWDEHMEPWDNDC